MTTINNSQLIEKVGGIEKAREIVSGAPTWATTYCMAYAAYGGTFHWYGACKNCYVLPALRTAIAEHDREFKVGDLVVILTMHLDNKFIHEVSKVLEDLVEVCGSYVYSSELRHATPSEIKAGHRLEAERHG